MLSFDQSGEDSSKLEYDKASLAFLIVILSTQGSALWKSFHPVHLHDERHGDFEHWATSRTYSFPEIWITWCDVAKQHCIAGEHVDGLME